MTARIAQIIDLRVGPGRGGHDTVPGISLTISRGETLGLVGASGSGKTTVALSLLGHLKPGLTVRGGSVRVAGVDPFTTRSLRGRVVSYLGQDPISALNPARRIGGLIAESIRLREPEHPDRMVRRAVESLCERMGLPRDGAFLRRFPHQISGGQAQRIALAMALAGAPRLLVIDEPTSMLDTETARDVRALLGSFLADGDTAALLVSHDPTLVSELADRTLTMPSSTRIRYRSRPALRPRTDQQPRLEVEELSARHGNNRVLDRISFDIPAGGCVALIGASGSGKTTTARCMVGLHRPLAGQIRLDGAALVFDYRRRTRTQRRAIALVAQDPVGALNPREQVRAALLRAARNSTGIDIETLLARVGLEPDIAHRRPGALSGGERQRVNLARALATTPRALICDEITSALDPTTAAAVLDLIDTLRAELGLAVLLITHDLDLVADHADQVMRMSAGRVLPADYGLAEK